MTAQPHPRIITTTTTNQHFNKASSRTSPSISQHPDSELSSTLRLRPRPPTQPCLDCQNLVNGPTAFKTSYANVCASARRNGCVCCRALARAMFEHACDEFVGAEKCILVRWRGGGVVEVCEVDGGKWGDELVRLEVWDEREQIPAISSPTVHLKPVLNDPGFEASLDLIRGWMRNCLEHHGHCRQESLPRLPTRVIDVSSTNLHIRETHGEKGLYMALSHCWGQERGLMLTQENLQVLTTKINIAALPKSIQHAIILARNLGVDSLWIDTLCIIQDSLQDWARESSSMCDVYCNSHLTIVAAGSPSDAQGFLDRRDDFPPTTAPSCPAKILSRRNPHSGPREPLYNRAWTFQERLLSPRMIKFKRHELEWHCRTRKVCECGHYTADATPYNDAYNNMFRDWGSQQQVYDFWRLNIVQSYSRLHLTNPSDRLPALSGLATMVARRFPELEYLSGLWAGDVVQGLQWYRDMGAEQSEDPQTLRFAPTWSWASILGPVTYPSRSRDQAHGTALASLRGYGYEGAGVDVHGEIKPGGWLLLLFAPVLQLRALVTSFGPGDTQFTYCFVQNQHSSAIRVGPGTAGKLQYYPDCARDPFGMMQMQGSGTNCAAGAGKERVVAGEKVWVPTVVLEAEEQSDGKARICRCLVLVVDSSDSTAFTRVGYLVFEDVHGWLEGAEYSAVRII